MIHLEQKNDQKTLFPADQINLLNLKPVNILRASQISENI